MSTPHRLDHRAIVFARTTLAGMALLAAGTPALAGPAYSPPQDFNRPGWAYTQLWDVNSAGQLVGQSYSDTAGEGFVYANGVFTPIAPAGVQGSAITGISDTGVLVGTYFSGDPDAPSANSFIYENGAFIDFTLPGATNVLLRRISANGRFVTGTLNDDIGGGSRGFVFDRQTASATLVPGNSGVIVQGVTSQGLAVGSVVGRNSYAFSFDAASGVLTPYTGIDLGTRPRFRDINDNGLITGFTGTQAFVGTPGNWTFFDAPPGMGGALGYGLNNQGDLVGNYSGTNGEVQAFVSSPIPGPAPWALLAGGLALLAWRRRAA